MRLDFWNNPLVVTALRLKHRRGSPGALSTLYLLGLVGLGVLLHHYWADPQVSWIRFYLGLVLALQFVIVAFFSLVSTSASLLLEVQQRTLDFQRIAALTPRQILAGKLLGEPVGGYFLALSTFPLALWCAVAGACALPVLLLFYGQMATTGLMFGAMGLVQPLVPAAPAGGGTNRPYVGFGPLIGFMLLMVMPGTVASLSSGGAMHPAVGLLLGTLTPIVSLIGLFQARPWLAAGQWFGVQLPSLLVAPCVQLLLAGFFFAGMSRKLLNPLLPLVSKAAAYATVAIVDVLIAGCLYDRRVGAWPLDELTAIFLGAHLAASLLVLYGLTPSKACLLSWLWRFRGAEPVRRGGVTRRSHAQ